MAKLVLVRHGESVWNKKGIFTGWVDVPLDEKGIEESKTVGKKLEKQKIKFDVVFTSTLERAQETLYFILPHIEKKRMPVFHTEDKSQERLSAHNKKIKELPIFESKEINERMYGDLQGKNKNATKKKFGEKLFSLWRRSYKTKPPRGESLEDTLKRALPYYKKKIEPYLKNKKNVLVVAHGNSLRAIVKHLEKISDVEIPKFEISTGKAIIYDFDSKLKIKNRKTI